MKPRRVVTVVKSLEDDKDKFQEACFMERFSMNEVLARGMQEYSDRTKLLKLMLGKESVTKETEVSSLRSKLSNFMKEK